MAKVRAAPLPSLHPEFDSGATSPAACATEARRSDEPVNRIDECAVKPLIFVESSAGRNRNL